MTLLHGRLDLLTLSRQLVFTCVLLVAKVTLGQFEHLNFLSAALFVLFGILGEFFKLVFLVLQRLGQVLDSAPRCLDLLLHAIVLLERSRESGHPELAHRLKDLVEACNIALLRRSELLYQLGLQCLIFENLHELHDV